MLTDLHFKKDRYYVKIESYLGDGAYFGTNYKECDNLTEAKIFIDLIELFASEVDGNIKHLIHEYTHEEISQIVDDVLLEVVLKKQNPTVYNRYYWNYFRESLVLLYDHPEEYIPTIDSVEIYFIVQELVAGFVKHEQ